MKTDRDHSRGVALEVVVDVDGDAGVAGLVCAGNGNLRWVRAASTSDLNLSTANVLYDGAEESESSQNS